MYNNDPFFTQWFGGPSSFTRADQGIGFVKDADGTSKGGLPRWMDMIGGVVFQAWEYKLKDVSDGSAKTYMVGEKQVRPEAYLGELLDIGDDQSCWSGDDLDLCRNADDKWQPLPDQIGLVEPPYRFGSAHASVFQMAFCDGSVQSITYDIDPITHERLGGRRDGEVVGAY
jgi:hypothetical protein